jgi:hypothetical protein
MQLAAFRLCHNQAPMLGRPLSLRES